MNEVKIIRKRQWRDDGWEYQAYCTRCLEHVQGERTNTWASKASALRNAEEHLAQHPRIEGYLDRVLEHGWEIVETVVG